MKIKGAVLKARINFIKKYFGEESLKRVLSSLPEEDAKILSEIIIPIAWYPFELGVRFDEAIVKVLGGSNLKIFEEIGATSARENLSTVHRNFLEISDPEKFLEKTPVIYKFYYDTGYRTYEKINENEGIITTYESENYSSADCLTVIGWYKEALKMCGAKFVEMEEEVCKAKGGPFCRYKVKFRK